MSHHQQNSQRKPGSSSSNKATSNTSAGLASTFNRVAQTARDYVTTSSPSPNPDPSGPPSGSPPGPPSGPPSGPPAQSSSTPFQGTEIYKKIQNLRNGDNGSTEIIASMLQLLSNEAGPLTHSSATLQHLFSVLLSSYTQILDQIRVVENANNDSSAAWAAFEKYTDAIPELERILLALSFVTKPESYGNLPLGPQTAVASSTLYIADWEQIRDAVLRVIEGLRTPVIRALGVTEQMVNNVEAAMQKDDLSMLRFLMQHVINFDVKHSFFTKKKNKHREDVLTRLDALQKGLESKPAPSEGLHRWIIKGILLVATPFAILNASASAEADVVGQMQNVEVWNGINDLLDGLLGLVNTHKTEVSTSEQETSKAAGLYEALLTALLKLGTALDISTEFLDLMRKYRKIRRPYTARAREIIQIVFELDEYSKKAENRKTTNRDELKEAIESLSESFNSMIDVVTSVSEFPRSTKDPKVLKAEEVYDEAANTLFTVVDSFDFMDEAEFDERLAEATKIDDEIFALFRDRI